MKLTTHLTMIFAFFAFKPGLEERKSDFVLIRETKEIRLYSRDKQLSNGSNTRELKAEFTVSASGAKVLEVLKNESYMQLWMNAKRIYVLNESSKYLWYTYTEYQLPWPLFNQDCILKYTLLSQPERYLLHFESIPDFLPIKSGVDRIVHIGGQWCITNHQDEFCRVTYTIYTEDKAKYPRWIADPIVQNNLINSLYSMKKLTEKLAVTNATSTWKPSKTR